jgi:hypothetical protein
MLASRLLVIHTMRKRCMQGERMNRPSYLLLLALASCTSSKLDSNATVTISGAARAQGGAPLSGAAVVFYKLLDVGDVLTTALELTSSLGTICLLNPSATGCAGVRTATTDAQGNFSFSLKGSDTQGTLGSASTLDVSVADAVQAGESAGATTTEQFQDQVSNLKLNDLRIWHPSTAFAVTGASVSLTFDSFPYGMATAGVTFQSNKGVPVWSQSAASGAAIDARLLEDTQGTVMVTAQTKEPLASGGDATFYYHSGQRAYPLSSTAPPSRGSGCFVQGTSGPAALSPCALTDGELRTAFTPLPDPTCSGSTGCTAQANNWAYVELPTAVAISLVVVRGTLAAYLVETSSDAAAWVSAGISSGGAQSFAVSATARYVRVRAVTPQGRVTGLAEISVW